MVLSAARCAEAKNQSQRGVEKNQELPENDPNRKYRRAVFQDNNVWDEEGN